MRNFIIYDKRGKILRTGTCQERDFLQQVQGDEFVIEGKANDATQKISGGKVVNKTPEELETEIAPTGPQLAAITNEQWQDVLNRLDKLDKKFIERK